MIEGGISALIFGLSGGLCQVNCGTSLRSYNNPMTPSQNELLRKIPSVEALIEAAEARWPPRKSLAGSSSRGAGRSGRRPPVAANRRGAPARRGPPRVDPDRCRPADQGHPRTPLSQGDQRHGNHPPYRIRPGRAARTGLATDRSGIVRLLGLADRRGRRPALRRDERIEELLRLLTGAEAATVVNNNAAATAIVLSTVAAGKEVIVSRGQLVEIGGSFRLPEIMAAAGAKLVEVGTTNKTHLRDYERAISERSAAILRVHPSNYKIVGFTAEVPLEELVGLGRAHGLTVIDDVGAGPLIDFSQFGFQKEPTLAESVAAGADVITSSGDKLIGGPQAGILLGKERWIQAIRKNPLARIVRPDKLALAALEATLVLFLDQQRALDEVPTLRMLRRDLADIETQAERIAAAIRASVPGAKAEVVEGFSQMGSGSLPGQDLPTRLVAVQAENLEEGEIARRLRRHDPPVFARVGQGRVLADPRTLLDGEEAALVAAFCIRLERATLTRSASQSTPSPTMSTWCPLRVSMAK